MPLFVRAAVWVFLTEALEVVANWMPPQVYSGSGRYFTLGWSILSVSDNSYVAESRLDPFM